MEVPLDDNFVCISALIDNSGSMYSKDVVENSDENDTELVNNQTITQISNSKKYTPINSYKPSGTLGYSEDLLNKIENKISR
jgi:hypothetical protein